VVRVPPALTKLRPSDVETAPKLFTWPPVRNVAHALERLSLIPLVAGSIFLSTLMLAPSRRRAAATSRSEQLVGVAAPVMLKVAA